MAIKGCRFSVLLAAILCTLGAETHAMEWDGLFSPVSTWLDETESLQIPEAVVNPQPGAMTFHGSVAQYYLGVIDGGRSQQWQYAGSGNYQIGLDLGKLGVQEGLSLRVLSANRWGNPLGRETGGILPPALDSQLPSPATYDLVLLDVVFTQVLNENLALFAGKIDTLDGDMNPFASGRGRTGFMNTSMLMPVNAIPTLPLSTLGAGAIFMKDGTPFGQLMILNSTDTTTTSGFDQLFDNGAAVVGAITLPVPLFGKFGIQSLTGAYNSKTFTALGQDPRVILPSIPLSPTNGSWLIAWSAAYYFEQFDPEHDPLNGWGLFARAGFSDPEVNPISHWVNLGIGGNSPIRGRHHDRFGLGWYYNALSSELGPIAQAVIMPKSYSTGMELYYNYAVNEHLFITPDFQLFSPGTATSSTATIVGVRVEIVL